MTGMSFKLGAKQMVKTTKKVVKKVKVSTKGKKVTKEVTPILPKEWGKVTLKKEVKKINKANRKLDNKYESAWNKAIKINNANSFMKELEQYCEHNPLCHIIDSGDGWAIVCKIVDLDVRVTRKGNNPFQDYSSENNSYHKVKGTYGVMAVISWDKNNLLLNKMSCFWDYFPDVYEVEAPGQITYWLDKLGKG
jgi:hypothetical protein